MATRDRKIIEEDLANVEFETSEEVEALPTFDSMGLREDLLRGIYAYGKSHLIFKVLSQFYRVLIYFTHFFQVLRNLQPFNKEQSNPSSRVEM